MSDKLRQALGYPDRYWAIREHAKTATTCVLKLTGTFLLDEGSVFRVDSGSKLGISHAFKYNHLKVVKVIDEQRVVVTNVP